MILLADPAPADMGQLVGETSAGQAFIQVVQVDLRNLDPERPDLGLAFDGVTHICHSDLLRV